MEIYFICYEGKILFSCQWKDFLKIEIEFSKPIILSQGNKNNVCIMNFINFFNEKGQYIIYL